MCVTSRVNAGEYPIASPARDSELDGPPIWRPFSHSGSANRPRAGPPASFNRFLRFAHTDAFDQDSPALVAVLEPLHAGRHLESQYSVGEK